MLESTLLNLVIINNAFRRGADQDWIMGHFNTDILIYLNT